MRSSISRLGRIGAALLLAGALGACAATSGAGVAAGGGASAGAVDTGLARAALQAGAPGEALNLANQALTQRPAAVTARLLRAEALARLGQPRAAAADFALVLQHRPHSVPALLGLGRLRLASDPVAAAALLRRALAIAPTTLAATTDLGIALDLQGQHAAAEAAYRRALALTPGLAAPRVDLALSLAMRGQGVRAVALLHDLAGQPKAGPKLREDYAAVLTMAGDRDRAAAILAQDLPPPQAAAALAAFAAGGAVPAALPPAGAK